MATTRLTRGAPPAHVLDFAHLRVRRARIRHPPPNVLTPSARLRALVQHVHAPQQTSSTGHAPGFRHDAVFYRGEPGFLREFLFVTAAVERDEPVLVAVIPARADALRSRPGAIESRRVRRHARGGLQSRLHHPVWNEFAARYATGRGAQRRR
jgi:hypothetical protein